MLFETLRTLIVHCRHNSNTVEFARRIGMSRTIHLLVWLPYTRYTYSRPLPLLVLRHSERPSPIRRGLPLRAEALG
jgi:hypothetical protein